LETFAAYQDKKDFNDPKILIVAKPVVQNRVQQIAPQILLLLSPKTFEIFQVSFASLPIKVLVRDDMGRIFVQTDHKIGEYELKLAAKKAADEKDSYILKPKLQGFSDVISVSPFSLFDVARIDEEYYLLLYKKTLAGNKTKKFIYAIKIQPEDAQFNEGYGIDGLVKEIFELSTEVKNDTFSQEIFSAESKQHVRACYDSESNRVFAIVASPQFAVLYKAKFTGD